MQNITISGGISSKIASVFLSIYQTINGQQGFHNQVEKSPIYTATLTDYLSAVGGRRRYAIIARRHGDRHTCYCLGKFHVASKALGMIGLCRLFNEKVSGSFEFQLARISYGNVAGDAALAFSLPSPDIPPVKPSSVIKATVIGLRATIEREAA